MSKKPLNQLTIAALLIGLGIMIPMVMPKVIIGPASFTLGSHVPVFIAMFFSPMMAVAVSLGTGLGFLLSATPIIAFRAFSHLIFAWIGAWILLKYPAWFISKKSAVTGVRLFIFNLLIGLIHITMELLVIQVFLNLGKQPNMPLKTLFLVMGFGGLIHSLIDFTIAYIIVDRLSPVIAIPVIKKAQCMNTKLKK